MLEWSYAAEYIEEHQDEALDLLEAVSHLIDWDQFDYWVKQIEGRPEYEQLAEELKAWDEEAKMLDTDQT